MRLPRAWLLALGAAAAALAAALLVLGRSGPPDAPNRENNRTSAEPSGPPATPAPPASPLGPLATQGRLAKDLASRFGLGDDLTEDRAIGLLASKGIAPDAGWVKSAPATEALVTQIQRGFHVMLTEVANDLSIQVPATLNLLIFSPGRNGGQTLHVGAKDMAALREGGGVVRPEALKAAQMARVSIEAPTPYPIGDDRLPAVWSYRLRRPDASFIRVHFEKLDLAPPSYLHVLDRYGLESWRYIGGEPRDSDIWASAVAGDTVIIALHAGAVASGTGVKIDSYVYGVPVSLPAK